MKRVKINNNIKIEKEWYDEADYRLSATSRAFYEAHPDGGYTYVIASVDFEAEGVAGTLEKGCHLEDFEFAFADSISKDIEGTTVSLDDVKNFVFHALTSQVEVRDDYGNILFVYRVDKNLNPPLWRKATHEEVREFILATEGYDIGDEEADIEKIMSADKYESWMKNFADARPDLPGEVKEKVYSLQYEDDKEFYNKAIQKRIAELKKFRLYEVGKDEEPAKHFSWSHIVKFSPYYGEYKALQERYEKIYPNIVWVETKAGNFLALNTDKVWSVKVPADKKGLFIGKGGANIKALAKKYGVRINLV